MQVTEYTHTPVQVPHVTMSSSKCLSHRPQHSFCLKTLDNSRPSQASFHYGYGGYLLPFDEVDCVDNIPAILTELLLALLQNISSSGSMVQVNFQRVLQEQGLDFHCFGWLKDGRGSIEERREKYTQISKTQIRAKCDGIWKQSDSLLESRKRLQTLCIHYVQPPCHHCPSMEVMAKGRTNAKQWR